MNQQIVLRSQDANGSSSFSLQDAAVLNGANHMPAEILPKCPT
jgi:hypothetical protein